MKTPAPLLAMIAALSLSGCVAQFGGAAPSASIGDHWDLLSPRAVLLEPPFVAQQSPSLCGLAGVEMLTGYYKKGLDPALRRPLLDEASAAAGIKGSTLKDALEKSGYSAYIYAGTLDREVTGLYYQLDRGRPLIVMCATGDGSRAHFLLVTGYDPDTRMIALLDPASGRHAVRIKDFQSRWENAGRFTLLAVPAA